jgi:hypothetical protein
VRFDYVLSATLDTKKKIHFHMNIGTM